MFRVFFALIFGFFICGTTLAQSGQIDASPSVVVIPYGQEVGSTTLNWTTQNVTAIHITVTANGGDDILFASPALSGSQIVPWIVVGNVYTFYLRANSQTGAILSQITISASRPAPPVCGSIGVFNDSNPAVSFITVGQAARLTANCSGAISTFNWTSINGPSTLGTGSVVTTNTFNTHGTYNYQLTACADQVCSQPITAFVAVLPVLSINSASLAGWDSYTVILSGTFDSSVFVEILSGTGTTLAVLPNYALQFGSNYSSVSFYLPTAALKDLINISPLLFRATSPIQGNLTFGTVSAKRSVLGFYDDYAIYMRRNVTAYSNTSEANPPPLSPAPNTQKWRSVQIAPSGNEYQVTDIFWGNDPSPEHHVIITCTDGQKYQWYYGTAQYPIRLTKVLWTENGVTTDKTDYFLNSCSRIGSPGAKFQVTAGTYVVRNYFVIYASMAFRQALLDSGSLTPPEGWDQMRYWQGEYSYQPAVSNPSWLDTSTPNVRPAILLSESEWFRFRYAPLSEAAWVVGSGPSDPYTGFIVPLGVVYGTTTSYALGAGIAWTHLNHMNGYSENMTRVIGQ